MLFRKKTERQCEIPNCNNSITGEGATIRMEFENDDYLEVKVCDECERLLEVLEEKSQELFNESL